MSLRYRIAVTIFILEAVMIAGVLWVTLNHSLNSTRAQMGYGEWVTLRLLSDLSRVALLTEEYAELQLFMESAREHPRLTAVLLIDSGGRVVAATDVALIGSPIPALAERPYRHWRTRDVTGASGRLGSLAVEFSEHPIVAAIRQAWNLGLGIAVSGMALIAVVGLTMGYVLTRRLERLAESADRVAAGDTRVRVNLPGRDEVARVGRAFDSMVGRLVANLKELEAARDRLIQPTEAMTEGFALWDADDRLVLCNRRYRELFGDLDVPIELGATFESVCRQVFERLVEPDGMGDDLEARIQARLDHHRGGQGLLEFRLRDGRWIGLSEFRTPDGGTVGLYTDITQAKERERALYLGEQRLRAIMNSVIDGIIAVNDEGLIESFNPAAERIFGYREAEVIGRSVTALIAERRGGGAGAAPDAAFAAFAALAGQGLRERAGMRRNGETFPVELSVTEIDFYGRRVFIATVRDITERKAAEAMIQHRATHDPLTGLPNRACFDERLRAALEDARRAREPLAVLFLDLDGFKPINDSLGHDVGDALLQAVAGRLRAGVRKGDTVARMGGDEFLFVLRGLERAEDVVKPVRHILAVLRKPFHVRGHELRVSASVGVSLHPDDGDTPAALLKHADVALYRAKASGRNTFELYNSPSAAALMPA